MSNPTALDEVTDIMRYTAVPTDEVGFRHDPAGEWVRFEDVAPELALLRRQVQELNTRVMRAHGYWPCDECGDTSGH